jgi:hypothetical protein
VKVEKLAKNGEKGQNSQPLSPGLTDTIKWFSENDDKSGYWGNMSSALVAHPT